MIYLVLGLVLFLGVHSISIIAPAWRDRTAARLGNAWRGLYSLLSIAGLIVLIWGYGIARQNPVMLYAPPAWARYITAVLMLPVFTLFLAAYLPGRLKGALKHPMLISIMLWAVAHLDRDRHACQRRAIWWLSCVGGCRPHFIQVAYAAADSHGAIYEVE